MSGQRRLINTDNTLNGNSKEALFEKLRGNMNEETIAITKKGIKYKNKNVAK